ncbi:MAG: malto-oligosyltrehalose trehalohydrolase [Gemmataceae bacterium]
MHHPSPGAHWTPPDICHFVVWAPRVHKAQVQLLGHPERWLPMNRLDHGYHEAIVSGVQPGQRYLFHLGDRGWPDPASRSQPEGVHGPSMVVDGRFSWDDGDWQGLPLAEMIQYEVHIGTFTREGTFDAAVGELLRLKEVGINTLEIMPVAQFPGTRNWGYDGVYPYAVQHSYGGPEGLKRLVNAAHRTGMAVILDVVYNHLGPEGNYLRAYGPYFTDQYRTPWGEAINFDGTDSDPVRNFFLENARMWQEEFHLDGLRLDAVHAIKDFSARPFLSCLAEEVHGRSGWMHLIAESDQNDSRLVRPANLGGHGLDAQWSDDFHHAAHSLLTGERSGYYEDYGRLEDLEIAYRRAFVFDGKYSPHRRKTIGNSSDGLRREQSIVFMQNHDQVGNRARGERLSVLLDGESQKLAAGLLLLSPFVPLLFMGEEYGEKAPFQYFISHGDHGLIEAVRRGRRREFAAFAWQGEIPDPQDERTFWRCKLDPEKGDPALLDLYRRLITLRFKIHVHENERQVSRDDNLQILRVEYRGAKRTICVLFHLGQASCGGRIPLSSGNWENLMSSAGGWPLQIISNGEVEMEMPRRSFAVFCREL